MGRAIVLVCLLAGCGRFGFGIGDDVAIDAANGGDDDADVEIGDTADAPTGMATLAQSSTPINSAGGNVVLTFAQPTTAGSLLVATFGANDTSNLMLPTGWMIAAEGSTNGGCFAVIAYLPDNPGGLTSVTIGQPTLLPTAAVATEWTGIAPTAPLDAIGTLSGTSPTMLQSVQTATATTAPDELALTVFCEDVNMPTYTGDPAWQTLAALASGSSSPSFISEYRKVAVPGVVGATVTSSLNGKYAAAIATFRSP